MKRNDSVRHPAGRLRRVLPAVAGVLVLCVAVTVLLVLLLPEDLPAAEPAEKEYVFDPVYDGDILQAPEYLELDRQIYFYDRDFNAREVLDEGQISSDGALQLLSDYLNSLINGYPEACRALFTESALAEHPVPDFAQQMIYRITLSIVAQEERDGVLRRTYCVDYMIHRNNGTYRRDVGSDAIRSEFITVIGTADGEYRIDGIRR